MGARYKIYSIAEVTIITPNISPFIFCAGEVITILPENVRPSSMCSFLVVGGKKGEHVVEERSGGGGGGLFGAGGPFGQAVPFVAGFGGGF